MNNKKVIIIGAGISGLCAGSYLQMNGYDTEIYELHNVPGGLCTAWKRKGYTFDYCIHWLVGSSPSDSFYALWNELIDMAKLEFVDHEVFFQIEDAEGSLTGCGNCPLISFSASVLARHLNNYAELNSF